MTDRLAEIKARQDQWSTVTPVCIHEDVGWLIAEVERLKATLDKGHASSDKRDDEMEAETIAETLEQAAVIVEQALGDNDHGLVAAAIRKEIKT